MLKCNFKNCFKEISNIGWVTLCSHIFCEEHGEFLENNWSSNKCPACEKIFTSKDSIKKMKTNPSVKYKSIVLSGFNAKAVLEIVDNGISFWTYQCDQRIIILSKKSEYYRTKLVYYNELVQKNRSAYEETLSKLKQKLDEAYKRIDELIMELMEL